MPAVVVTKLPIEPANNQWLFFIAGDPSSLGLPAAQGSLATRIDGSIGGRDYTKFGANDTDWSLTVDPTKRIDNGSQASNFAVDFSAGLAQRVTLAGSIQLTLQNGVAGDVCTLELVQDGIGSRVPSFSPALLGTVPTWSTVAGRRDLVQLYFDGSNYSVIASAINA